MSRLLQEIVSSSATLRTVGSAAVAEAWASGAIAEWRDVGGDPDVLVAELGEVPLAASLIDWLVNGTDPATSIGEAVRPDWIDAVASQRPLNAVELRTANGTDQETAIVMTFVELGDHVDEAITHDISVAFETGDVRGLTIGGAGLLDGVDTGELGMTTIPLDVDDAMHAIRQGLARADRAALTEDGLANVALFERRFGVSIAGTRAGSDFTLEPRDLALDQASAEVIRAALRPKLAQAAPPELGPALEAVSGRWREEHPDMVTAGRAAGLLAVTEIDESLLFEVVAGYMAPTDLADHDAEEASLIADLEHADWIGAVLGATRAPTGTEIDGDFLVDCINRCPEITTSIPKADRSVVAWSFERTLYAWEICEVLDEEGRITRLGQWILPRAAMARWQPPTTDKIARPIHLSSAREGK